MPCHGTHQRSQQIHVPQTTLLVILPVVGTLGAGTGRRRREGRREGEGVGGGEKGRKQGSERRGRETEELSLRWRKEIDRKSIEWYK
jgi:hypothetical protein